MFCQAGGRHGKTEDNQLPLLFFYRSHAAYKAACGTSMAGQAPETFVLLRSCLEYSGYALLLHMDADLATVWLRRHQNADALRKMRKEFQGARVQQAIDVTDAGLAIFTGSFMSGL